MRTTTTATLERILARLHGVTGGRPQWYAKCPAHHDRRASLSVAVGEDGTILLFCHAGTGCALEEILTRLGVRPAELFPTHSTNGHRPGIVATYEYTDEAGHLLFQVVRYADKSFKQRQPDGKGGWIWNLQGVRRVVYRLRELKGQARVFVVEGEKDVDRLWLLGVPATTNPGGAGKWKREYAGQLRAMGVKELVVIPDNDASGEVHAAAVVRSWR